MFLSRIQLTSALAKQSQLGLLLRDRSYGLHRLLWDLFPSGERFLFREENSSEQGLSAGRFPLYYVLSTTSPKTDSPLFEVQAKAYSPELSVGESLTFKLRANPTVARKVADSKNSKRHDVVMDAKKQFLLEACKARSVPSTGSKSELRRALFKHSDFSGALQRQSFDEEQDQAVAQATYEWLAKRGEQGGFHLENSQATGYNWRALPEKGRNAGFSSIDYEGVLKVTDPETFITGPLFKGLGPSKAFGCGLMLIRRIV